MTTSTYQASGRIPGKAIFAILTGLLAVVCSALAYAWLMANLRSHLWPDMKPLLTVFAVLGVGMWMSRLGRRVASAGKIRNPAWMGRVGFGLGLLAWYVQWAAYIVMNGVLESGEGLDFSVLVPIVLLCLRPEAMFDWAFVIPLFDASIFMQCGVVFCWFVEFCVHVFPPMLAGRERAGMPFCETSGRWAHEIEVEADFEPLADPEAAGRRLETDPACFASMLVPRTQDAVGNHTRVTLYRCAGPESFITIRHLQQTSLDSIPLPPEAVSAMVARSPDAECFWEQPVVELLRVPLPDPDALLRRWSCVLDDQGSRACSRTESERPAGPILSKS